MKTIHIVGARPQFIKMATVSRAIAEHNKQVGKRSFVDELTIHTGQHYDYELSKVFFDELKIPKFQYSLKVGSGRHGEQTGKMLTRIEQVLLKERPDIVLVYGDTNSTLAGALAAVKLHIPVAHVEAGLRSYNRRMPEEINRVLTDHVSTILFCPTETAVKKLQQEGFTNIIYNGRLCPLDSYGFNLICSPNNSLVINVGDVMFDSTLYNFKLAERKSKILKELKLAGKDYYLATVHRAENTEDSQKLKRIFSAFQDIAFNGITVICPLHPRTRKALTQLDMGRCPANLRFLSPVSYFDMLFLEKHAKTILTDSGGIQKEAYFLRVPCVTLRKETEWLETVKAGWNVLAGVDKVSILKGIEHFRSFAPDDLQINLYGDGDAGRRIVKTLSNLTG